jgi:hypothetical protein
VATSPPLPLRAPFPSFATTCTCLYSIHPHDSAVIKGHHQRHLRKRTWVCDLHPKQQEATQVSVSHLRNRRATPAAHRPLPHSSHISSHTLTQSLPPNMCTHTGTSGGPTRAHTHSTYH